MKKGMMLNAIAAMIVGIAVFMLATQSRRLDQDAKANKERIGTVLFLAHAIKRYERMYHRSPASKEELESFLFNDNHASNLADSNLRTKEMLQLYEFVGSNDRDIFIKEQPALIRGTSDAYAITRKGKVLFWENGQWKELYEPR